MLPGPLPTGAPCLHRGSPLLRPRRSAWARPRLFRNAVPAPWFGRLTITQQLAKNLFLTLKAPLAKLEEALARCFRAALRRTILELISTAFFSVAAPYVEAKSRHFGSRQRGDAACRALADC
jgi:hypothetical protein